MLQVLPFNKLTDIEVIAIEQTANGLWDGTLSNWPYLIDAFNKLGLPSYKEMSNTQVRNLCKLIVKVWK